MSFFRPSTARLQQRAISRAIHEQYLANAAVRRDGSHSWRPQSSPFIASDATGSWRYVRRRFRQFHANMRLTPDQIEDGKTKYRWRRRGAQSILLGYVERDRSPGVGWVVGQGHTSSSAPRRRFHLPAAGRGLPPLRAAHRQQAVAAAAGGEVGSRRHVPADQHARGRPGRGRPLQQLRHRGRARICGDRRRLSDLRYQRWRPLQVGSPCRRARIIQ